MFMALDGIGHGLWTVPARPRLCFPWWWPMRRHPDYSMQMGSMLTCMRTLAMQLGPTVLVNAIGVGAIGDPLIAGDAAMVGHASVGRAGTEQEVVDTILFLCDPANTYLTGQMLSVDGGWSAGYGRNF